MRPVAPPHPRFVFVSLLDAHLVAPPHPRFVFVSLLDAHLAEQRRRNAESVAELQRLVASGEITRVVVEVRRG